MIATATPCFRRPRVFGLLVAAAIAAASARAAPVLRTVTTGNRAQVQLRELAAANALRLSAAPEDRILLANAVHVLRFKGNSREMSFNGTAIWLNSPVVMARGYWAAEQADATALLDPLLRPNLYLRPYRAATVLLDPGHGGKDTGAIGPNNLLEKDLALDIARRARIALVNAGFRVRMTRDSDRFVELTERAAQIARVKADLFISIHLNSASGGARGVETYLLPAAGFRSVHEGGGPAGARTPETTAGQRHSAANAVLAHALQRHLRQQTALPDRGVRTAHYAVLKNATAPAALVECGFLSHASDVAFLRQAANRDQIARGIALGVAAYAKAVASAQPRATAPPAQPAGPPPPVSRAAPPSPASAVPPSRPAPPPEPLPQLPLLETGDAVAKPKI